MLLFVIQTDYLWVKGTGRSLPSELEGTLCTELFIEQLVALTEAAIGDHAVIETSDLKHWNDGTVYEEASYVVNDLIAVYADRPAHYRRIAEGLIWIAEDLVCLELGEKPRDRKAKQS